MKTRMRILIIAGCLSVFAIQSSFAESDANRWQKAKNNKGRTYISTDYGSFLYGTVITFSDGPVQSARPGQAETLPPAGSSNYAYTPNSNSQLANLFGLFVGGEFQTSDYFLWQLGLAYYQPTNFEVNGTAVQGPDPTSYNQYNYSYDISSRQYMVETKLLLNVGDYDEYHPYFSVDLGVARNRASGYMIDHPEFITFSPVFGANSVYSFSYMVGVGIDYELTNNWRFGAGYRFADLGKVSLGSAVIDTTPINGTISQSHFYLNELLAQVTYIF